MAVAELTCARALGVGLAAGVTILVSASWVGAHGGDRDAVHGCVVPSSGYLRIIDPDDSCKKGETALDWTSGELAPGTVLGEGNNATDGVSGHLALNTVGRANLVDEAVDTAQLAPGAVTADRVSANDLSNLTGANVRTGTLHGTLVGPPTNAPSGDIALGTLSGQGDNDDTAAVRGNLGLDTVGRHNLVDEAVDVSKLSSVLLADLVTERELTVLLTRLKDNDRGDFVGPNDGDGFVHWNHLEGVPSDVMDGDDNGTAAVQELREALRGTSSDRSPDDSDDLVSLDEITGLTSGGDGRIVGEYLQDGTVTAVDLALGAVDSGGIRDGAITAADLAGSDVEPIVLGAVTSTKIADGTIESRDLHGSVVARFDALEARLAALGTAPTAGDTDRVSTTRLTGWNNATQYADPPLIGGMSRAELPIPVPGLQVGDLVTVSPPAGLADDLLFVGHDVQRRNVGGTDQDVVVVYLYNNTTGDLDDAAHAWRVQYLDLTP